MYKLNRLLKGMLLTVFVVGIVFGQTYLINETFGTVPPAGWTNGATAPIHGTTGYDDAHSLYYPENKTGTAVSIATIAVTDPDRLSFWYAASNAAFSGTFTVKAGTTAATGPFDVTLVTITSSSTTYAQSNTELSLDTGTYYLQLELAGNTSNRKDLNIDVFQVTQSIVPSTTTLSGFAYEPSNGPSAEQSFTVSGVDLTADITVKPPTNYEISTGTGGAFSAADSITLTQSGGTVNATNIYIRLKSGLSEGAYNGEVITISSTDKISKTVTCSGDVRTSISVSTASLTNFNYDPGSGPSAEQSFSVNGQDLSANIVLTPPTNYEISTGTGGAFSPTNPITLTQIGGSVGLTTIYVRLKSGLSQGTYNSEDITLSSTGKASKTVTCSGFVGPLILNIKVFLEGGLW